MQPERLEHPFHRMGTLLNSLIVDKIIHFNVHASKFHQSSYTHTNKNDASYYLNSIILSLNINYWYKFVRGSANRGNEEIIGDYPTC